MIPDPTVTTSTLSNGLRVTTVALPHLHTATVALFVKAGSRFEAPEDNGLSHFVEHMLFRGTRTYPTSLALNTAVEALGSTLQAETGRDHTLFQLDLAPHQIPAALDLLGELLGSPRFSDIELERALVLAEFNELYGKGSAKNSVDDSSRALMFGEHPFGQCVLGTRSNIKRFSESDVRRHFHAFYGAANTVLCIAGPVEHKTVTTLAAKSLATLPPGQKGDVSSTPPPPAGPLVRHVGGNGEQVHFTALFHGIPEHDPGYPASSVLLRILDGGMSTRLHYQLADQKGLAYSIHADIEACADVTLFEVCGGTAPAKAPELLHEVLALLGGLCQGQIDPAELVKARARTLYEALASMDDTDALASWFGGSALYYPPQPLSKHLDALERIAISDVVAAARRIFRPKNLVITVDGNLSWTKTSKMRAVVRAWQEQGAWR